MRGILKDLIMEIKEYFSKLSPEQLGYILEILYVISQNPDIKEKISEDMDISDEVMEEVLKIQDSYTF